MPRFALLAALALAATAAAVRPARRRATRSASTSPASTATSRPGDGFDRYANGGWRAHAEMPADRTGSARSSTSPT